MNNVLKRFLSSLLVVVMVLSMMPATVFALEEELPVFVDGQGYASLEAAAAAANSGAIIKLMDDVTLSEVVTLPAGVTLDGNGKTINGTVKAGGDLTFAGKTVIATFNPGWYNNTITVGKDASLEVTAGRVTVSYGNVFNIVGNIADAKTADKATVTPSLKLNAGISMNGNGGGVEFNITNAYVVLGDSSSKNSGATGEFNFNIDNSIVEFTKTLKTYQPTVAGLDPVFNLDSTDSVVSFASHLELWNAKTNLTLDNTSLTVGGSFANAGTVEVTNGSYFLVKAPIMSSHGGNTGTIVADGGVFELADSNEDWQNAGTMKVAGNGKLVTNDFKCVNEGQVVVDVANIPEGAVVIEANDDKDFISGIVIENGTADVTLESGKIVVENVASKTYAAEVNGEKFESFDDAIAYANEQTGAVNVTLLTDVQFSGDDLYADVVLDLNGKTITATGSYVFWFEGGSLVVKDSSAEKTGMIDGSATVGNAFLLMNGESLTIESGKIYANNNVIYVAGSGATVTVNGGELKSVIDSGNLFYLTGEGNTITVNNGTFLGNVNPYAAGLTINGGTFTADVNAYCAENLGAVKNADGMYEIVRVDASNAAAQIGDKYYMTLSAAINAATANDTIVVLKDVTEQLPTLKGKIVPANESVTITATNNDWLYLSNAFEIGEGVTLNIPNGGMFVYYTEQAIIKGNVVTDALYLAYAGTKLTVYEPGSLTVTSETFIVRYMSGDVDSGLYIVGDNNDETIGLNAEAIYFYQGTISAKDANIKTEVYWQTQETDGEGSANLILDNTKMDVTQSEQIFKATGISTVTLKNGSILTIAKDYEGVQASVDATSSIIVNGKRYYVALVNGVSYKTLEAAIEAAGEGDTVTVLVDLSDLALTIGKSLTITSAQNVKLTNVSINGTAGKLTVSNLTFAGNSWINAGGCDELVVENVTANVTPSNGSYTNSRSAFIGLGRNEAKQLKLTVTDCNIVVPSGTDAVLGWAAVTEVTISGNTFGSETSYQNGGDIVKFMAIADGAVFHITNNTSYSNYNGFVFAQNTTRNNAYAVYASGNTFYGGADHIWIEISGGNTVNAKIEAASDNTVNGNAFTVTDIKYHSGVIKNWNGYAGVNVTKDAEGKLTGGSFLLNLAADLLAEGYMAVKNADGTYSVVEHTCSYTATVTTAPTTATEGVKTFTCSCGDSYTETMPVLPQAKVTDKGATTYAGSYFVYDIATGRITSANEGINLPKTLVFTALEEGEAAANNYYANYNTDFYVKLDGLSAETVKGTGCYLAGYYAAYEMWVVIPLDNVDIQKGIAYPLLAIAGQDFSYEMICNGVKEFTCGLYLSDEFLAANPDVKVTVDLGLREEQIKDLNQLPNLEYYLSEGFEYEKTDLDAKLVAMVNGVKYYSLQAAIDAAADGATVTVLADIELTEKVNVPAGKTITLNLNGYDLTVKELKVSGSLAVTGEGDINGEVLLTQTTATVTTDKTLTISSGVEGNEVVYADGVYKLVVAVNDVVENVQTGVTYTDLQEALSEAAKGETVKLLQNVEAEEVYVPSGRILDLNGNVLTVTGAISATFNYTHIIDSTNGAGLLAVDGADIALNGQNKQLPVWTDEGIRFVEVKFKKQAVRNDENSASYKTYLNMKSQDTILDDLLKNDTAGISFRIKVTYTTAGGMKATQYFQLSEAKLQEYLAMWDSGMIKLNVTGIAGKQNIAFTTEIVSTLPDGSTVVSSSEEGVI